MVDKIKVALSIMLTIIITTSNVVVNADTIEEQLQQYNQNIGEDTLKLSEYEKQEEEIILAIQELDSKIESAL